MWKTLSPAIRSKGLMVLNVARSAIASLSLSGGKTTHSTCNIPQGSLRARLLIETK